MARRGRSAKAKESIRALREEFWKTSTSGERCRLNQSLEGQSVADYLEFAELMIEDALSEKSPADVTQLPSDDDHSQEKR